MTTSPGPTQERNLELASDGLESWISGDVEGTLARFTEDIEVFVPPELANTGRFRGKEQFLKWIGEWDEAWSEFSQEVQEILPVGERHVVAMVRNWGRGRGSGVEVATVLGWVLSVRDEQMDFLSLQPDRESAIELAREREASEGSA